MGKSTGSNRLETRPTRDNELSRYVVLTRNARFWQAAVHTESCQPEGSSVAAFTDALKQQAGRAVAVRLELDEVFSEKVDKALLAAGWHHADEIQYQATVLVDLDRSKRRPL